MPPLPALGPSAESLAPQHLCRDRLQCHSSGRTEKAEGAALALQPEGREALCVPVQGANSAPWSQCCSSPAPDISQGTSRANLPLVPLHLFWKSFWFLL